MKVIETDIPSLVVIPKLYDPKDEGCLIWNGPGIGIDWRVENPELSEKDKK